jgi:hypothetical protein
MSKEVSPKSTTEYRILMQVDDCLRRIGSILIDTFNGDLMYIPSQTILLKGGSIRELDHVSFHESGRTHLKFRDRGYEMLPTRSPIKKVGYQVMFKDNIHDATSLPLFRKKVREIDMIFQANTAQSLLFELSIISGKLIVQPESLPNVTVSTRSAIDDPRHIDLHRRSLGWHSGNADKLLQYSLRSGTEEPPTHKLARRTLFIPTDSTIALPDNK